MIGSVYSGGVHGIDAYLIFVECDISEGFPSLDLFGMLSGEVKEARERVLTSLANCGVKVPQKKITVNMAPANIKKHGTGFDLPIAVSVLVTMGEITQESIDGILILGELMLSGEIGSVRGVLPIVKLAKEKGIKKCMVPKANAAEAAVIEEMTVIPVTTLSELLDHIRGVSVITPQHPDNSWDEDTGACVYDLCDVAGQKVAKRGIEIGASGLHNILMVGPPGTGKTFLSKCLPGIMPPMSKEEALEVSAIYSVAGLLKDDGRLVTRRPFVEAHHTATDTAMSGGGNRPRPGMITLAHRGVLFLDEMPEFSKRVLEVLRQPIEDKVIHIARNGYNIAYPADFMLIGAMNPCPCGMYPDMSKCTCSENMRRNYIGKLSKPLVDRMDICLQVLRPKTSELMNEIKEEKSADVRARVTRAQNIQRDRFKGTDILFNSQMGIAQIEKYCKLGGEEKALMERAIAKYDMSARSYHRVLKTARTIADMDASDSILSRHLTEAIFFRCDIK